MTDSRERGRVRRRHRTLPGAPSKPACTPWGGRRTTCPACRSSSQITAVYDTGVFQQFYDTI